MDYTFLTEKLRSETELAEYLRSVLNNDTLSNDITTDAGFLDENLDFLNKGVFWIVKDRHNNERFVTYKYPSNLLIDLLDKHRYSYENIWNGFDKSLTQGKPFYYFPRGRYVIRKDKKVIIYCSTFFAEEKYRNMITAKLKLKKGHKGISSIDYIFDNALHYQYNLEQ